MIHFTQKSHSEEGFTLVELMATIAVLGIAVLGISTLYYNTQYIQRQSSHLDSATRAAQTEIEILRNNSYNALTPGDTISFTNALPSDLPASASGTVVVSQPKQGLRRVDVTVAYTDSGKAQSVTLSSLIGVIGIGQ